MNESRREPIDQEGASSQEPSASPAAVSALGTVDRFLRWLSSLQVGIALMLILIVAAIVGTLIPQHNMEEFDRFYARLTPAERALYDHLGLFDVYHSWWFTAAVFLFALNLVLCSIDRLPMTLQYLREPKVSATPLFAQSQPFYEMLLVARHSADVVDRLTHLFARFGWRPRQTVNTPFPTVFGERGVWSRWNFFLVHGSLLVILGAAFVGARWGYEGTMILSPGTRTQSLTLPGSRWRGIPERQMPLPFTVRCESLRVALKNPRGPLVPQNVINWYTDIVIEEAGNERRATIAVNKPFDYRGYRFFQSGTGRPGDASRITLVIRSEMGPERTFSLAKNQAVTVPELGEVRFLRFAGDFRGSSASGSDGYENPAAELEVTLASGERHVFWVFPETPGRWETTRGTVWEGYPSGYRFVLKDFDKVSFEHILHVQYDPGVGAIYVGFALLALSLSIVFFSAHERVWAVLEPEGSDLKIHLAAHANRNEERLRERFHALVRELSEEIAARPPTQ
ncbi:MAG: cytochrome c biogenesis protein ResB [Blastocatellia bacterium]|nr:cytochrome c biogenesis protein ResB [Blastocatellia bacterium]MCX7752426.1 cytochrome c biogenesis protein ResB [Blastocatellia bacterium]